MGRKKTPIAVLNSRDSFRNHPERRRENEPVVIEPLGSPPEGFEPDEREVWLAIAARAPMGALTAADWQAVVIASKLFAAFIRDSDAFDSAKLTRLQSLLGSFGMTPSDRASLNILEPKRPNPFDEFH